MSAAAPAIGMPSAWRRVSTALYLRPGLVLFLLLTPPMLWLGIVYLGSLFALLAQSFFYIDGFTGQVVREVTLATYAELFTAANIGPRLATRDLMADLRAADPFRQGGGRPFTKADRSGFLQALDQTLRLAARDRPG